MLKPKINDYFRKLIPYIYFWFFVGILISEQIAPKFLFSFQLMTKICRNFYVIFLRNASSNNVCVALGKTQNTEKNKKIT